MRVGGGSEGARARHKLAPPPANLLPTHDELHAFEVARDLLNPIGRSGAAADAADAGDRAAGAPDDEGAAKRQRNE